MQKLTITVEELKNNTNKYYVIDVREPHEIAEGGRMGFSVNIPNSTFMENIAKVPKDKNVTLHCKSGGGRSAKLTDVLRSMGYDNVVSLEGGIEGWKAAGLPVL